VHETIAVGVRSDRAVGVVRCAGGIGAGLGRLTQCIRCVAERAAIGVGGAGQVTVRVVAVGECERRRARDAQRLGRQQAALVIVVIGRDRVATVAYCLGL